LPARRPPFCPHGVRPFAAHVKSAGPPTLRKRTNRTAMHKSALVVALLSLTSLAEGAPNAGRPKLDPALWRAADRPGSTERVEVITQTAAERTATLRTQLQGHGDQIVDEHPALGLVVAKVHAQDLRALENDPSTRHVSSNAIVIAHAVADRRGNGG